ncbi:MAG: UDP-glucose/GDP-mannose dehydrogenase family protein [Candidatus Marinimicrobia bacterium]|jgi:UDPglucose 6-dehydrogenase|nr:UDP-glucose/GDP-mannose dehydrogenase family protein [Candidatus Neomarinimicrobiota bacterium]MBT3634289.1 UDP-glucose/GDP-mannose dehydrogenase family protein [Candidatus Neomarinimicrobiota bacterium]MBT3682912.1 UDP-glucose/GDP-mannose dehydrogenase family protein [Candidatus Neomarinimicrobiota bacterium]MBT3760098.1 UDP-glucose/GDP-mannose dehydrogenase family protein [Candidatus Neomarinimicrobiota bacterium]MBT3896135.1 UDP-glucose/GDP-mannose dehydrogenase family protein [Candidatus
MSTINKNISLVGLGKLGLCTASCMAASGYNVLGFDINKSLISQLKDHVTPYDEKDLETVLEKAGENLTPYYLQFQKAIDETDITFIIVPTPSMESGSFSTKILESVLVELSMHLKNSNKDYHLIVVVSTVSPETIYSRLIPLVESKSGRIFNKNFGMCYNPEFIALGSVIKDFYHPDMVLIGHENESDAIRIKEVYQTVCKNDPVYSLMSINSAEITKISLNAYITMKISFANTLANLCYQVPKSNIDDITTALGADRRVGSRFLKGGAPFGGPCFPRDSRAFSEFARSKQVISYLAEATDQVNKSHSDFILDVISRNMGMGDAVGVLGLSYKHGTPVIEESFSLTLIHALLKSKHSVYVYDKFAMDNARGIFQNTIHYSENIEKCLLKCQMIIITTSDNEFQVLPELLAKSKGKTIIDIWRIFEEDSFDGHTYIGIGS